MSEHYQALPEALRIPGARSVMVFSLPAGSRVWSATAGGFRAEDTVATVIDMASAAQRLVDRVAPGDPVEEILALDGSWFHVFYLLAQRQDTPLVAHVLFDRTEANLGHARREFRALVEAERAARPDPSPATLPRRAAAPADDPPQSPPPSPVTSTTGVDGRRSSRDNPVGPFSDDLSTLQRVLVGLRRL